jgi:hypothetical protein
MSEKGTADEARAEVPTSSKPAVSACGLAKCYGKVEAVRGSDR